MIQQCCLSLSKSCKKGSRTTAAALIATLGETSFVLTGGDGQSARASNGGPEEARAEIGEIRRDYLRAREVFERRAAEALGR